MPTEPPFGSGAKGPAACVQQSGNHVTKHDNYGVGRERRRMFRCQPVICKAYNFAGVVTRQVSESCRCDHCENNVASHEGPRVDRHYDLPVAQAPRLRRWWGRGSPAPRPPTGY